MQLAPQARAECDPFLIADAQTNSIQKTRASLALTRQLVKERYTRKNLSYFLRIQLKDYQPGQRILFIGAGGQIEHTLREILREKGVADRDMRFLINTVDIEPSTGPDILADLNRPHVLPANTYDWVLMMEVVYALSNPQNAFRESYRTLKRDGRLIFSNMYAMPVEGEYHAGNFTDHELKRFAEAAGFTQVEVSPRNNWAEAIGGIVTRLLRDPDPALQAFARSYMGSEFALKAEALAATHPSTVKITSGWYGSARKVSVDFLARDASGR